MMTQKKINIINSIKSKIPEDDRLLKAVKPKTKHEIYLSILSETAIWSSMKQRCSNEKMQSYANYGGRGITVCDRWKDDFFAFYMDVGPRPSIHHSLDRIDNNKGYSPENCRWATREDQSYNRRDPVILEINGEVMTVQKAIKKYRINKL